MQNDKCMLKESNYAKIQIVTPVDNAPAMRSAIGRAGAGEQGKYVYCTSSWRSTGRFLPLAGAQPAIGKVGEMEEVEEEIIQVICHKDKVADVIRAIKETHPYEEPAIDIFGRFEVE